MQDIMPPVAANAQLVQSYGADGFRIGNQFYPSHVLVLPDKTIAWNGEWGGEMLAFLLSALPPSEVILLGTGAKHVMIPASLRQLIKSKSIGFDTMDTGAACRTFNILLGEGRRVAAAFLLPNV